MNYWEELLIDSFERNGISISEEQLKVIAEDVKMGHEMYGEYTGEYLIPNPLERDLEEVKKSLEYEKSLVFCKECKGTGSLITYGGTFCSTSPCWNCSGKGKHKL